MTTERQQQILDREAAEARARANHAPLHPEDATQPAGQAATSWWLHPADFADRPGNQCRLSFEG